MPAIDLLVLASELRSTSGNKPYYNLKVRKPTGSPDPQEMDAKVWSDAIEKKHPPVEGKIISAYVEESEYQGLKQLVIKKYMYRSEDYDKTKFQVAPAVKAEDVYDYLIKSDWKDGNIKRFMANLDNMLVQTGLKAKLLDVSAATKNHHARRAGLLQHTQEMWMIAKKLLSGDGIPKFEGMVNLEILLAAIVMHDMGKVHEYNTENNTWDPTRIGALYGHTCWGAFCVMSLWPQDASPEGQETKAKLIHCILAHHGSMQTGAAIEPKIPEATLISLIDLMSAKLDCHRTAWEATARGEKPPFTKSLGEAVTPHWPILPKSSGKDK